MEEDDEVVAVIQMPYVKRAEANGKTTVIESAEQIVCPFCISALELAEGDVDYTVEEFDVNCPDCDRILEIHPQLAEATTPINFIPAPDLVDFLDAFSNKTAVLNAAVRILKDSLQEDGEDESEG
jgi:hypothetical protein